jgi:hypothetical protein
MMRPGSLAEVARRATSPRELAYALPEFLDEFAAHPDGARLAEEPQRLHDRLEGGDVADAYLAAVAVALARSVGVVPPAWAWQEDRKLREPWFAHPGAALRATLLLESPAAFRERNLFVSANALSRA